MGELSRIIELTRFAELTRFVYFPPIILTLRLHGKRVVLVRRDPACDLPRNSPRRDERIAERDTEHILASRGECCPNQQNIVRARW